MNILKILVFILVLSTVVKADSMPTVEAKKTYEEEMNLAMCHSAEHHFNADAKTCSYCAQGLHYDHGRSPCVGTPNMLGKCYGEDHYYAKMQECIYCVKGHSFDEDIRKCIPIKEKEKKKEKI